MVQNASGTKMFRCLYAENDGELQELLGEGKRSCAVFVSSVLYLFDLIDSQKATVVGLERGLIESGWCETIAPQPGEIIFWEPQQQNGGVNAHAGFYLGKNLAISNDWRSGIPIIHHMTYGITKEGSPVRKITAIYTHQFLK